VLGEMRGNSRVREECGECKENIAIQGSEKELIIRFATLFICKFVMQFLVLCTLSANIVKNISTDTCEPRKNPYR